MLSSLKPVLLARLGRIKKMSRHFSTSLPCFNDDGETFDWKYFLKPLAGKRNVETTDDLVTHPEFGQSEPDKCLYHVISQALVNQKNDTETLKSERVEKLKRKISTKLKPDEFLSSVGKVRRLDKTRSLNVPAASQVKSDLLRSITDPGLHQNSDKTTNLLGVKGSLLGQANADESFTSSDSVSEHASTLSLADSGFDEVDAKMMSPERMFRRPQLYISPMKRRKLSVPLKSEVLDSEEIDINDNFSLLSPPKVKQSPSSLKPILSKKIPPTERKVSLADDHLVKIDLSDSPPEKPVVDIKVSQKLLPDCEILDFDVVPPRISSKTNKTRITSSSQVPFIQIESSVQTKVKRETVQNVINVSNETDSTESKQNVLENKNLGLETLTSAETFLRPDLNAMHPKQYSEVKKEKAGLEEFQHVKEMFGKYTAIKNIRPDLLNSASRWTIPVLQRYIKKEYIDLIIPMIPTEVCQLTKKERAHLKKQLIDQSILMFSPGRYFTKAYPQFGEFQNWKIQEADIRLFLNVLLRRLCLKLHMQMRVEERITGDNLPNAICDYAFYKNNVCIGLLEAKSPSGLEPKAIPQFLVELLNIQARYASSDLPIFGILSDAHRFVFINLLGVKFSLEQTEMLQLYVHEVFSWTDLFDVADVILSNFHKQHTVLSQCLQSQSESGTYTSDDSDVTILE